MNMLASSSVGSLEASGFWLSLPFSSLLECVFIVETKQTLNPGRIRCRKGCSELGFKCHQNVHKVWIFSWQVLNRFNFDYKDDILGWILGNLSLHILFKSWNLMLLLFIDSIFTKFVRPWYRACLIDIQPCHLLLWYVVWQIRIII